MIYTLFSHNDNKSWQNLQFTTLCLAQSQLPQQCCSQNRKTFPFRYDGKLKIHIPFRSEMITILRYTPKILLSVCVWWPLKWRAWCFYTQLQSVQSQLEFQEQSMVEKSLVSRQEAKIRELETKLEYERTQIKRLEVRERGMVNVCGWIGR